MEHVELAEGLAEIGYGCLSGCGIKRLEIPSSVRVIGECAFNNCLFLESVTFGAQSQLQKVGPLAFQGTKVRGMEFPAGADVAKNVF